MKPSLSVLIPCYNVGSTVASVVRGADSAAKKFTGTYEILAIDDASRDATASILAELRIRFPALRVITHPVNLGYGRTIKELYMTAKYNWLFSLPGDGQFDAAEIRKLLPETARADMILGWRNHRNDPANRLVQSRVYNGILNALFRLNLHDVNTIRLMKKAVISGVTLKSDSAFVDAELAIAARKHGFIIREIPVTHRERRHRGATGGKFVNTIWPTILDILRTVFT